MRVLTGRAQPLWKIPAGRCCGSRRSCWLALAVATGPAAVAATAAVAVGGGERCTLGDSDSRLGEAALSLSTQSSPAKGSLQRCSRCQPVCAARSTCSRADCLNKLQGCVYNLPSSAYAHSASQTPEQQPGVQVCLQLEPAPAANFAATRKCSLVAQRSP